MKLKPFRNYTNEPNFSGYPVFYIVDSECVCGDCCNQYWQNKEEYFLPIDHPSTNNKIYNEEISEHVNWEDPYLYCSIPGCEKRIPAAYNEDSSEEESDSNSEIEV